MRPVPYNVAARPVTFLDWKRGAGVTADGRPLSVKRTRAGRLVDVLDAVMTAVPAVHVNTRALPRVVMLTGDEHSEPDGWRWIETLTGDRWRDAPSGHFYDDRDPCGRFVHVATGEEVHIRRALPWGYGDASPHACRDAHQLLARALARHVHGARLYDSPAGTGQDTWARSLPDGWTGEQLDDELCALIRATSPQHRMEATASCYDGCDAHVHPRGTVGEAHYLDGRFMFADLLSELGTAPARRLSGDDAGALFYSSTTDRRGELRWSGAYRRARYRVRFAVPDDWHHVGLLLERHPDGEHWHAPNRPGYVGDTWCDAAELHLAVERGWVVELLEGIDLMPSRVLDTWRDRMLRALAWIESQAEVAPELRRLAGRGLRACVLQTIGSFHSTGRPATHRAPGPAHVPPDVAPADVTLLDDGSVRYVRARRLTGRAAAFVRPELSAQVWGRSHARLLSGPGPTGALYVDHADVLGMWGDALYLARDPGWTDNGRVGRLRSKGSTAGRITRPRNVRELDTLRRRIEKGNR